MQKLCFPVDASQLKSYQIKDIKAEESRCIVASITTGSILQQITVQLADVPLLAQVLIFFSQI